MEFIWHAEIKVGSVQFNFYLASEDILGGFAIQIYEPFYHHG